MTHRLEPMGSPAGSTLRRNRLAVALSPSTAHLCGWRVTAKQLTYGSGKLEQYRRVRRIWQPSKICLGLAA